MVGCGRLHAMFQLVRIQNIQMMRVQILIGFSNTERGTFYILSPSSQRVVSATYISDTYDTLIDRRRYQCMYR